MLTDFEEMAFETRGTVFHNLRRSYFREYAERFLSTHGYINLTVARDMYREASREANYDLNI